MLEHHLPFFDVSNGILSFPHGHMNGLILGHLIRDFANPAKKKRKKKKRATIFSAFPLL